jgi:tetratricopeptide (TPR) repeat protein
LVGRYEYRQKYGLPAADDDLNRAQQLDKDHKHVHLCLCVAERARIGRQFGTAKEYFEHAIAAAPKDHRGYLGLGATYAQQRQFDQAIKALTRGLKEVREYDAFTLRYVLGDTLLADGRLSETGELLNALDRQVAELIARSPGHDADRRRSSALALRGRWHMARAELVLAETAF